MAEVSSSLAEGFASALAGELEENTIIVLVHPWSDEGKDKPAIVRAPGPSGHLDVDDMAPIAAAKTILVPVLSNTPEDLQAAESLVPQLPSDNVCILATLLLPPGVELTRELMETMLHEHDQLLALGFDDVISMPDAQNAPEVRESIATCRESWELLKRRIQLQLLTEPRIDEQELRALQNRHNRVLLQEIPRALMPRFPVQDPNLKETSRSVGEYAIFRRLTMQGGKFFLAESKNGEGECCMINAIDKSTVTDIQAVESIYRERRLLSDCLSHPNITQCIDAMHSNHRVYLVFAYAGELNLTEYCSEHPGERLHRDDALKHFDQVASALWYCHTMGVALRALSIDNVLMCRKSMDEGYECKLMSCSAAIFARMGAMSTAAFGALPCIAPEVSIAHEYNPYFADCWSIGIILLEMAGGLSSTARAVPFNPRDDPPMVAPSIVNFFSAAGSQKQALAKIGNVQDPEIDGILQALLRPVPNARATMKELVDTRQCITPPPVEEDSEDEVAAD